MGVPLPSLTFYRMPDQNPAAATIAALLDAIYASLSSATDYRGTSLASTHLWTWARFQNVGTTEAVYASAAPSGTPMTKSPQIILCGTSGGPAVTVAPPDASGTANVLYLGINKNGGAYNAYTAALPFTSGSFFGYWKASTTVANSASTIVRTFISQETVFIQIIQSVATAQNWMYAGAIVEPYDEDTTNSAETDNRLYGISCGGANNSTTWLSAATTTNFLDHGTAASNAHTGLFTPNAATHVVGGRRSYLANAPGTACLQTPSGVYVGDLQEFGVSTASITNTGLRYGTFRGLYIAGLVITGRYLRNGSTDLYHFISMNTGATAQGMMIPAVS